jgi:hypothetical protein
MNITLTTYKQQHNRTRTTTPSTMLMSRQTHNPLPALWCVRPCYTLHIMHHIPCTKYQIHQQSKQKVNKLLVICSSFTNHKYIQVRNKVTCMHTCIQPPNQSIAASVTCFEGIICHFRQPQTIFIPTSIDQGSSFIE